jgi:hypothetical protein
MLRRRISLPGGDESEVNFSQDRLVKRYKEDAEKMKMERMAKLKTVGLYIASSPGSLQGEPVDEARILYLNLRRQNDLQIA